MTLVGACLLRDPPAGFKPESHLFRVGDKPQFYGLTLDEAVLGKKKGEAIEVSQEGTGTARGAVQAIKQKVLPELDDEFAKDLGDYKTLAELREKVGTQLEQGLKRDIEETYKDQIMKRLVELHHFDIPESLVQRELARRLLVSNGNLTGLTTRLVKEGLVTRTTSARDALGNAHA